MHRHKGLAACQLSATLSYKHALRAEWCSHQSERTLDREEYIVDGPYHGTFCLPRFAQAYDFVGSYILGIGRGYRDTRRSRLRIMGKPVLPLLAGLALLHSSLLRSSSIVPLHLAMHIRHINNRGLMV